MMSKNPLLSKQFNHVPLIAPHYDKITENGSRYYLVGKEKYPSITTLLGQLGKDDLEKWRQREGIERADAISKTYGNRGTNLHKIAENYLNNEPDYLQGFNVAEKQLFKQIKKYIDRIDNVQCQETPFASKSLKVAGTADAIGDYGEVLSVIDFKNSRKMKRLEWIDGYFYQTCFYGICYYELTKILPKQLVIIMADGEGGGQAFIEPIDKWLRKTYNLVTELRNNHYANS